jgi:hypothetical protein
MFARQQNDLKQLPIFSRPDLLMNWPSFRGERLNRMEAVPSRHPERMIAAEKSRTGSG